MGCLGPLFALAIIVGGVYAISANASAGYPVGPSSGIVIAACVVDLIRKAIQNAVIESKLRIAAIEYVQRYGPLPGGFVSDRVEGMVSDAVGPHVDRAASALGAQGIASGVIVGAIMTGLHKLGMSEAQKDHYDYINGLGHSIARKRDTFPYLLMPLGTIAFLIEVYR